MPSIRNTRRFRELSSELRERCSRHGVVLLVAEAEDIFAEHVAGIANRLGVTDRTALDRYAAGSALDALVQALASASNVYDEAVSDASPMIVSKQELGGVVAALGMSLKLAVDAIDAEIQAAAALGMATDCADAVVGFGAALREATDVGGVEVDGMTLVFARKVLGRSIDHLRTGVWHCQCSTEHSPGSPCSLVDSLSHDLGAIGGWPGGEGSARLD